MFRRTKQIVGRERNQRAYHRQRVRDVVPAALIQTPFVLEN